MGSLFNPYGNALGNYQGNLAQAQGWSSGTITTSGTISTTGAISLGDTVWYDYQTGAMSYGQKDPLRQKALPSLSPNQAWLDERVNEMRVAL